MRQIFRCCVIMLAAGLLAATANADIISYSDIDIYDGDLQWGEFVVGFEDLPLNTDVTDQYSHLGVYFLEGGYGGSLPTVVNDSDLSSSFPIDDNALRTHRKGDENPRTYGLRMDFTFPVRSFGGYHIDVGETLFVEIYDTDGTLLSAPSFAGGGESGNTATFFGIISDSQDMSYVDLYTSKNWPGDLFGVDEMRWDNRAVPEPSSLLLYAIGAGVLSAALRRRR